MSKPSISKIELCDLVPEPLAGKVDGTGDIWGKRLTLSRPGCWLIDAESGAGKTSLCAFLTGRRTDYRGRILFDGRDLRSLSPAEMLELRRTSLAWLPQDMQLFGELTARQNVALKNALTGCKTAAQIDEMLARLGLEDKLDARADRLSIGQQQRVAIVRTLCQPFDFLLLDEPVSHLDEASNRRAALLIAEEAAARGAGVIITSVGNPLAVDNPVRLVL